MDLHRKRRIALTCLIGMIIAITVGPFLMATHALVGVIISSVGLLLWIVYMSIINWCEGYERGRMDERIRQIEIAIQKRSIG